MGVLIMAVKTPKTLLGEPEEYAGETAQDSVTVHVLGFDQITRENFRVKLQAQAELTGGRDPEGLPLGVFLNGILIGKATFDEFGVADIALTIDWAALAKGKTLTVKVKGIEQAVPVQWDIPKSPQEEEKEETERLKSVIEQINGNMVSIYAGTFWMGTTNKERRLLRLDDYFNCERPRHQVKLAAFAISKYPVTQAQWHAVMGNNPSNFKGDDLPVEQVSWHDCQAFCQKLSSLTGTTFRLPTEAEWECACRAGTKSIWPFGNDPAQLKQYAWFLENSEHQPHPIGKLKLNVWGLYDMLGNVWEWCADWFDERYYANSPQENPLGPSDGQYRLLRGGAWGSVDILCRSACRLRGVPDVRNRDFGFRVVCSL